MVRAGVFGVLLALGSPPAFAGTPEGGVGAAAERVLLLSDSPAGAARLERALNQGSSARMFLVFPHASRAEADLRAALDRYSPGAVVAVRSGEDWSAPVGALAGILPDVVFVERDAPLEDAVPALQARLGVAAAAAPATRDEQDRLSRRAAELHRAFDAAIEENRLLARLEKNPGDLDVLGALVGLHRSHIQHWHALTYLDRMAASPQADASRRADILEQAGEIRLQIGDFPRAAADFRRALELKPGDPRKLLLLAEANREHPEEALRHADRAARAAGASSFLRARILRLAGELRADIGDAAGAEKNLELALKDAPGDLDALYAIVRVKRANKPGALPYARRASKEAAAAPLWLRGAASRLSARIWLELDEPSRAADELARALRLDPEDIDALRMLVPIKSRLAPKQLAGLRWAVPSPGEAEAKAPAPSSDAASRRALRENPGDLEALLQLAEFNRIRRRPAEAAAYAQRLMDAVWSAPVWQQEDAAHALVRLWLALGEEGKANLVMNRVLERQSDAIASWRLALGMPQQKADAQEASWVIGAYCTAASMRLELGDRTGAEEELKRALRLAPADPWALELMAALVKNP